MSRQKYGAKRTVYDGITYASKAEAQYAERLQLLLRSGEILKVEPQPVVQLVDGVKYIPDFLVTERDGETYYVDVKGFETQVFKLKKRLWKLHGPGQLHIVRKGKTVQVIKGPARP